MNAGAILAEVAGLLGLIGTPVQLAEGEIKATVIGLGIYAGPRVLVQCAWWVNGDRKEQWLELFEVIGQPQNGGPRRVSG